MCCTASPRDQVDALLRHHDSCSAVGVIQTAPSSAHHAHKDTVRMPCCAGLLHSPHGADQDSKQCHTGSNAHFLHVFLHMQANVSCAQLHHALAQLCQCAVSQTAANLAEQLDMTLQCHKSIHAARHKSCHHCSIDTTQPTVPATSTQLHVARQGPCTRFALRCNQHVM